MELKKTVQTFYQVVNNNLETITVKNSLKEAKEFIKSNKIDATFLKPDFVINADQEQVILYGVTQKAVHDKLIHYDDFLWANEKEARKFYESNLLDFKKELEKDNSNNLQQYIEKENEIRTDSSYLIFSKYQIDL